MKRLLLTIHDVTPRHAERLERIEAVLERLGLEGRYGMLVVPNFWGEWPLEEHREFAAWLRGRAEAGVEMILHGLLHRDEARHRGLWRRFQAAVMTNREGEFLGLDAAEARARLEQGRALLAELLGAEVRGFVAPAWLYGPGALEALEALGFRFAEDHGRVWSPATGETLVRGPVVSYASRDRRRVAGSLLWSRLATVALRPLDTVRMAIHPHDLDVPVLAREIERALAALLREREPVHYEALAA